MNVEEIDKDIEDFLFVMEKVVSFIHYPFFLRFIGENEAYEEMLEKEYLYSEYSDSQVLYDSLKTKVSRLNEKYDHIISMSNDRVYENMEGIYVPSSSNKNDLVPIREKGNIISVDFNTNLLALIIEKRLLRIGGDIEKRHYLRIYVDQPCHEMRAKFDQHKEVYQKLFANKKEPFLQGVSYIYTITDIRLNVLEKKLVDIKDHFFPSQDFSLLEEKTGYEFTTKHQLLLMYYLGMLECGKEYSSQKQAILISYILGKNGKDIDNLRKYLSNIETKVGEYSKIKSKEISMTHENLEFLYNKLIELNFVELANKVKGDLNKIK